MHHEHDVTGVSVAILTLSDTRSFTEDRSGQTIQSLLKPSHRVVYYKVMKDDPSQLQEQVNAWVRDPLVDVVITNGGTGMSRRDQTHSTIKQLLEKEMIGFGEQFRQQSFEEIGPKAMLSNAIAGSVEQTSIFSLPGSTNAVQLAMKELILPILPHLTGELRK
ncbi:LOW QUALITY PROTEIN: molybdenum cofactor biosynthesis protein MoaB [Geomicrobium sp. JCM 19039]|nr:LOW QUALITY PROTEIN: molybdenum cofactor biosynthesis protein MoaB [Geomicrobium sp. JCM 19039]